MRMDYHEKRNYFMSIKQHFSFIKKKQNNNLNASSENVNKSSLCDYDNSTRTGNEYYEDDINKTENNDNIINVNEKTTTGGNKHTSDDLRASINSNKSDNSNMDDWIDDNNITSKNCNNNNIHNNNSVNRIHKSIGSHAKNNDDKNQYYSDNSNILNANTHGNNTNSNNDDHLNKNIMSNSDSTNVNNENKEFEISENKTSIQKNMKNKNNDIKNGPINMEQNDKNHNYDNQYFIKNEDKEFRNTDKLPKQNMIKTNSYIKNNQGKQPSADSNNEDQRDSDNKTSNNHFDNFNGNNNVGNSNHINDSNTNEKGLKTHLESTKCDNYSYKSNGKLVDIPTNKPINTNKITIDNLNDINKSSNVKINSDANLNTDMNAKPKANNFIHENKDPLFFEGEKLQLNNSKEEVSLKQHDNSNNNNKSNHITNNYNNKGSNKGGSKRSNTGGNPTNNQNDNNKSSNNNSGNNGGDGHNNNNNNKNDNKDNNNDDDENKGGKNNKGNEKGKNRNNKNNKNNKNNNKNSGKDGQKNSHLDRNSDEKVKENIMIRGDKKKKNNSANNSGNNSNSNAKDLINLKIGSNMRNNTNNLNRENINKIANNNNALYNNNNAHMEMYENNNEACINNAIGKTNVGMNFNGMSIKKMNELCNNMNNKMHINHMDTFDNNDNIVHMDEEMNHFNGNNFDVKVFNNMNVMHNINGLKDLNDMNNMINNTECDIHNNFMAYYGLSSEEFSNINNKKHDTDIIIDNSNKNSKNMNSNINSHSVSTYNNIYNGNIYNNNDNNNLHESMIYTMNNIKNNTDINNMKEYYQYYNNDNNSIQNGNTSYYPEHEEKIYLNNNGNINKFIEYKKNNMPYINRTIDDKYDEENIFQNRYEKMDMHELNKSENNSFNNTLKNYWLYNKNNIIKNDVINNKINMNIIQEKNENKNQINPNLEDSLNYNEANTLNLLNIAFNEIFADKKHLIEKTITKRFMKKLAVVLKDINPDNIKGKGKQLKKLILNKKKTNKQEKHETEKNKKETSKTSNDKISNDTKNEDTKIKGEEIVKECDEKNTEDAIDDKKEKKNATNSSDSKGDKGECNNNEINKSNELEKKEKKAKSKKNEKNSTNVNEPPAISEDTSKEINEMKNKKEFDKKTTNKNNTDNGQSVLKDDDPKCDPNSSFTKDDNVDGNNKKEKEENVENKKNGFDKDETISNNNNDDEKGENQNGNSLENIKRENEFFEENKVDAIYNKEIENYQEQKILDNNLSENINKLNNISDNVENDNTENNERNENMSCHSGSSTYEYLNENVEDSDDEGNDEKNNSKHITGINDRYEEIKIEDDVMIRRDIFFFNLLKIVIKKKTSEDMLIYLHLLNAINIDKIFDYIIQLSCDIFNTLLNFIEITKDSSTYRLLLKNLGAWIGIITIGRNKPLISKYMNIKQLILYSYDNGYLIVTFPAVCKILESIKNSKIFKPPNPWTIGILNLLGELHEAQSLKTILIFEIEILFNYLKINVFDYYNKCNIIKCRNMPINSNDLFVRNNYNDNTANTNINMGYVNDNEGRHFANTSEIRHIYNKTYNTGANFYPNDNFINNNDNRTNRPIGLGDASSANYLINKDLRYNNMMNTHNGHIMGSEVTSTSAISTTSNSNTNDLYNRKHLSVNLLNKGDFVMINDGKNITDSEVSANNKNTYEDSNLIQSLSKNFKNMDNNLTYNKQIYKSNMTSELVLKNNASQRNIASTNAGKVNNIGKDSHTISMYNYMNNEQPNYNSMFGNNIDMYTNENDLYNNMYNKNMEYMQSMNGEHIGNKKMNNINNNGNNDDILMKDLKYNAKKKEKMIELEFKDNSSKNSNYTLNKNKLEHQRFKSSDIKDENVGIKPEIYDNNNKRDSYSSQLINNMKIKNMLPNAVDKMKMTDYMNNNIMHASNSTNKNNLNDGLITGNNNHNMMDPVYSAYSGVDMNMETQANLSYKDNTTNNSINNNSSNNNTNKFNEIIFDEISNILKKNIVLSPSISILKLNFKYKALIYLAFDSAIKEIVSSIVDRFVLIGCITTRELVKKDFLNEQKETIIQKASLLMATSITSSLALVSCKKPLKNVLVQNLRNAFEQNIPERNNTIAVDDIIKILINDNINLIYLIIEQIAIEKSSIEIEEIMKPIYASRKYARIHKLNIKDNTSNKYYNTLPVFLKAHNITLKHIQVYKNFMNLKNVKSLQQKLFSVTNNIHEQERISNEGSTTNRNGKATKSMLNDDANTNNFYNNKKYGIMQHTLDGRNSKHGDYKLSENEYNKETLNNHNMQEDSKCANEMKKNRYSEESYYNEKGIMEDDINSNISGAKDVGNNNMHQQKGASNIGYKNNEGVKFIPCKNNNSKENVNFHLGNLNSNINNLNILNSNTMNNVNLNNLNSGADGDTAKIPTSDITNIAINNNANYMNNLNLYYSSNCHYIYKNSTNKYNCNNSDNNFNTNNRYVNMQIINNDGNSGIYAYDDQCPPNYSGNYPRNYIENGANNFSENTENLYSQNTNQKYENSYTHHLPKISTSNIFQAAQNLEDLKNGNMRPSNNDSENSFPQFSNIALNPNFESKLSININTNINKNVYNHNNINCMFIHEQFHEYNINCDHNNIAIINKENNFQNCINNNFAEYMKNINSKNNSTNTIYYSLNSNGNNSNNGNNNNGNNFACFNIGTSFPIPPYMNNIKRDCSSLSGNINDTKTGDLNNEHNTTAFNSGILNNYDTTRNVIMSVNKDLEKKKNEKEKEIENKNNVINYGITHINRGNDNNDLNNNYYIDKEQNNNSKMLTPIPSDCIDKVNMGLKKINNIDLLFKKKYLFFISEIFLKENKEKMNTKNIISLFEFCMINIKDYIKYLIIFPPIISTPNTYSGYCNIKTPFFKFEKNVYTDITPLLFITSLPTNHKIFKLCKIIIYICENSENQGDTYKIIGTKLYRSIQEILKNKYIINNNIANVKEEKKTYHEQGDDTSPTNDSGTKNNQNKNNQMNITYNETDILIEIQLCILELMCIKSRELKQLITSYILSSPYQNINSISYFIRYNIINLKRLDKNMRSHLNNLNNTNSIKFCTELIYLMVIEKKYINYDNLKKSIKQIAKIYNLLSNKDKKNVLITIRKKAKQIIKGIKKIRKNQTLETTKVLKTVTEYLGEYKAKESTKINNRKIEKNTIKKDENGDKEIKKRNDLYTELQNDVNTQCDYTNIDEYVLFLLEKLNYENNKNFSTEDILEKEIIKINTDEKNVIKNHTSNTFNNEQYSDHHLKCDLEQNEKHNFKSKSGHNTNNNECNDNTIVSEYCQNMQCNVYKEKEEGYNSSETGSDVTYTSLYSNKSEKSINSSENSSLSVCSIALDSKHNSKKNAYTNETDDSESSYSSYSNSSSASNISTISIEHKSTNLETNKEIDIKIPVAEKNNLLNNFVNIKKLNINENYINKRAYYITDIFTDKPIKCKYLPSPPNINKERGMIIACLFAEWYFIYKNYLNISKTNTPNNIPDIVKQQHKSKCIKYIQKLIKFEFLNMDKMTDCFFTHTINISVNIALYNLQKDDVIKDELTMKNETNQKPHQTEKENAKKGRKQTEESQNENYEANNVSQIDNDNKIETLKNNIEMKELKNSSELLNYNYIDSWSKMIVIILQLVEDIKGISPIIVLQKVLNSLCRIIHKRCEIEKRKFNQRPYFRLLHCLLNDINEAFTATTVPNIAATPQSNDKLIYLNCFSNCFAILSPIRVPSFSFSWLELISSKYFMPILLSNICGWGIYKNLLVGLFTFLKYCLKKLQISKAIESLYIGAVRILLVLLHDFPEFLCSYYVTFCSLFPINCIQLRNIVLSAFPRNIKLPDPFMPNIKMDALQEIKLVPKILTNTIFPLFKNNFKQLIDDYFNKKKYSLLLQIKNKLYLPKNKIYQHFVKYDMDIMNSLTLYVGAFICKAKTNNLFSFNSNSDPILLIKSKIDISNNTKEENKTASRDRDIIQKIILNFQGEVLKRKDIKEGDEKQPNQENQRNGEQNNNFLNKYVDIIQENNIENEISSFSNCDKTNTKALKQNSVNNIDCVVNNNNREYNDGTIEITIIKKNLAYTLFLFLLKELDMEGRYLLLLNIVNHIRYPNSHTHYFSCLILFLFSYSNDIVIKEQIIRVLLERILAHRPHPWGLLITFIELIKNKKFKIWEYPFVHATSEIKKIFKSVFQTCLGNA
ncbi:NOT family protein, putative [Plasmodium berghei]|uniref:NOT family protein, putative n=1 Tax=Plasmodium berghei TaxID=5821 RepID=A0A0Y9X988_PLABE|nr:NOT family protein, putative [Plasmodium berghei]SCM17926.1 NOT family protein, putative [Plasmodium berghei]